MASWRMQSTASTLGVIAIVSVMITATASEVESGFDHSANSEDSLDFPSGERTGNESAMESSGRVNGNFLKVDAIVTTSSKNMLMVTTSRLDVRGEMDVGGDGADAMVQIDGLQRDQSDRRGTQMVENDPEGDPSRTSSQDGSQRETYEEHFVEDDWSSRSTPTETTSIGLAEVLTLGGSFIENQNVRQSAAAASKRTDNRADESAVIDDQAGNEAPKIDKQELTDDSSNGSLVRANSSISPGETLPGPKDGKHAANVRTSAFQVSSANGQADTVSQLLKPGKNGPGKIDGPAKSVESRKDHSRPANNLLVSGKSTKAFYEIKPSIKTEINGRRDQPTTSTAQAGRRFVLPSVDSAFGKFGPYFEDGEQEINMTARIGTTVLLDCKIGMLGDKKVTWVQHVKDSFRLLTVGRIPYSVDQRISLQFRYPSNWRLQILYATPRDSGLYQCQVATHPPLVKKINVIVTAPVLTITDDSGRTVAKERHLKAGSALRLRCEAWDVLESQNESVVWTRGDETLAEDVSENRTTEISVGKEVLVIVSTLIVERASPRHAGNYSCLVPGKAKTTIAVHVLNGELPAAVHDGSGVSRAVLNLWLIHLTVSYVFFR